jgi:hypothetical protein
MTKGRQVYREVFLHLGHQRPSNSLATILKALPVTLREPFDAAQDKLRD